MGTYRVLKNGNAPSNLKKGDYVVTNGGLYQIVTAETPGASYNESSGYYSKLIDPHTTVANYGGRYDKAPSASAVSMSRAGDAAAQVLTQAAHKAAESAAAKPAAFREPAAPPAYQSDYRPQIAAQTQALLEQPQFRYDYREDPNYTALRKEYLREADRSAENTLGAYAAMTGGMPSTAALTAAQQAADYQKTQLTDSIPRLYELAYAAYQNNDAQDRANLELLAALEKSDYQRYQDQLRQANSDRDFSYRRYQDALGQYNTEQAQAFGLYDDVLDALDRQASQAYKQDLELARTLAAAGDYSGYAAFGMSDEQIAALNAAWREAQDVGSGGRSGGGRSSRGGATGGNTGGDEEEDILPQLADLEYLYGIAANVADFRALAERVGWSDDAVSRFLTRYAPPER